MPRNYRHIKEYEKEICELKEKGLTNREIAEKFGFELERVKGLSYNDQLLVDDFSCLLSDSIHSSLPFHLVSGFECFRDAVTLGKLFYQLRKHFFCLLVDVCKVVIHLTADD